MKKKYITPQTVTKKGKLTFNFLCKISTLKISLSIMEDSIIKRPNDDPNCSLS